MSSPSYNALLENNREWVNIKLNEQKDYFNNISKRQAPEFLIIGCSDSRVPINLITGTEKGDIFVHRNIANIVNPDDINTNSVVEYSLNALKVKHIIILGHYQCGGIKAIVDGIESLDDSGLHFTRNWISSIKDLYDRNIVELDKIDDPVKLQDRLSELNVVAQTKNLIESVPIKSAFGKGIFPHIHGWIYNIYTGLIMELDLPLNSWIHDGILPDYYR